MRLAAISLLRQSNDPAARTPLASLLADGDPQVRFAAVEWVAEEELSDFRPQLTAGLAQGADDSAIVRSVSCRTRTAGRYPTCCQRRMAW